MKWTFTILSASILSILFSVPASAEPETGWRLKLNLANLQSTAGGDFDPSAGVGVAAEYRASRRLGFELSATTAELESEVQVDLLGIAEPLFVTSRLDTTPILARLNWYLTPDRKADVFIGPVAGWVRYSDVKVSLRGPVEVLNIFAPNIETEDAFAWGAHAGLDVPFGDGGWFFNGGVTYLEAEVDSGFSDETLFELNPLTAHVGFGYRF